VLRGPDLGVYPVLRGAEHVSTGEVFRVRSSKKIILQFSMLRLNQQKKISCKKRGSGRCGALEKVFAGR
jgi:hypothetical protein